MNRFFCILLMLSLICFYSQSGSAQTSEYSCSYGAGGAVRTFNVDVGFQPVCTMSWTFIGGPCDGADMVTRFSQVIRVDGNYNAGWQMKPWNPTPILIRSFSLSKLSGGPHGNMFIGNSYVNDVMVTMGPERTTAWAGTPSGTGIPFPGTSNDPGNAYFDLHGACTGGGTSDWRVDIAYSPMANEPPPPPPPPGSVLWNSADKGGNIVLSNGGLSAAGSSGVFNSVRANQGYATGKRVYESVVTAVTAGTSVTGFGTSSMSLGSYVGATAQSIGVQAYNGAISASGFSCNATGVTFSASNVMTWAVDLDARKIWLAKNGAWVGGGDPAAGTNPLCTYASALALFPAWSSADGANTGTGRFSAASIATLPNGFSVWED